MKIWNFSRYSKLNLLNFSQNTLPGKRRRRWQSRRTRNTRLSSSTIFSHPRRYHTHIDIHTSNLQTERHEAFRQTKERKRKKESKKETGLVLTPAITHHLRCAVRRQLVHVTTSTSVFIISNCVTTLFVRERCAGHKMFHVPQNGKIGLE